MTRLIPLEYRIVLSCIIWGSSTQFFLEYPWCCPLVRDKAKVSCLSNHTRWKHATKAAFCRSRLDIKVDSFKRREPVHAIFMLFPFPSHAFPVLYLFSPNSCSVEATVAWILSARYDRVGWGQPLSAGKPPRVEQDQNKINLSCFCMLLICSTAFYTPPPHVSSWEGSANGIILDATNFGGCQATATIVTLYIYIVYSIIYIHYVNYIIY